MATDDKDLRSERPLTEKGQSLYESTVNKYQSRINDSWKHIELLINTIDNNAKYSTLCKVEDDLEQGHAKFTLIKEDFVKFLSRTNTTDSDECLKNVMIIFDEKTGSIEEAFHEISELKADKLETASVFSRATSRLWSGGSHVETVMAVQRAKAQAARIRLKYAEEENLVLKRKAQLEEQQKLSAAKEKAHIERFKQECEAELKLLDQRKAAAEEDAALNALELEAEEQGSVVYRLP